MSRRAESGGTLIDRSERVTFQVDGQFLEAFRGDTVASAMLASGLTWVGNGIYSGRPRGIQGVGAEDPNAFVQVVSGAGESMALATEVAVRDGLAVERVAGRGRLRDEPDEGRDDHAYAHAEVVVVGAGAAGISAALQSARGGGRVVLLDNQPEPGGWLVGELTDAMLDDLRSLRELSNVEIFGRTTAVGLYDHGQVVAVERRFADEGAGREGRRLWQFNAHEVVLATGALERPMAFPDNDLPGVMLAGAAAAYARRYGVLAGERAVVWTAHDAGLHAALELAAAGIRLVAVLDVRDTVAPEFDRAFASLGLEVLRGAQVLGAQADQDGVLCSVRVRDGQGTLTSQEVDLLAISGGLNPTLHLHSQLAGRLVWSPGVAGFVNASAEIRQSFPTRIVGSAAGDHRQDPVRPTRTPPATWFVGAVADEDAHRVYLDLHRDATLADLRSGRDAGLVSVEHIKRYTTIGTGADQGRSSGVLTVGALAGSLGVSMDEVGTTTYRPPYAPVSFGLLAGRRRGPLADPVRRTAMHDQQVAAGATFEDVGQWKRAWYFPAPGESMDAAVQRECRAVREAVGMMDASTLGKIVCHGADTGAFLDRFYAGLVSNLLVGRIRYSVMCGADGMLIDDGTLARLSELDWLVSTTTGNAAMVMEMLEEWLQTEWPWLDVRLTSVTEQWAVLVVAGPRSRAVLEAVTPDLDVSADAFGFMEWRDALVADIPARLMRISFSGELAFEVHVPARHGGLLWSRVRAAGEAFGITPYGTESMHLLRAEKGFPIIGQETDGTVTPFDLGMEWAVSKKKVREGIDFMGARSLAREEMLRPERRHLVGLQPVDGVSRIIEGSQLVDAGADLSSLPVAMLGHVTSAYPTSQSGTPFALALLAGGRDRLGEDLDAVDQLMTTRVRVVAPVSYDPEGERRDG